MTATRPFRQHHDAPLNVSAIYRPLLAEWVTLQHLPSTAIQLRRWARTHPILTDYPTPGDLVDAIDAAPQDIAEQHLIALVRIYQAGNQLAGRIVLQAMLPAINRIVANRSIDDQQSVLAEFWIVLSTITITDTTTRIAANLKLSTLRAITRPARPNPELLQADPLIWHAPEATDDTTDTTDLADVIAWAHHTNAITTDEAAILTFAYTGHHTDYTRPLATHLGIAPEAAKKRCTRAREKLINAVRQQLDGGEMCSRVA